VLLDGLQLVTEITEINASPFRCPPSLGLQPSLILITFPTQANAALSCPRLFLTQLPAFAAPTNTAARQWAAFGGRNARGRTQHWSRACLLRSMIILLSSSSSFLARGGARALALALAREQVPPLSRQLPRAGSFARLARLCGCSSLIHRCSCQHLFRLLLLVMNVHLPYAVALDKLLFRHAAVVVAVERVA